MTFGLFVHIGRLEAIEAANYFLHFMRSLRHKILCEHEAFSHLKNVVSLETAAIADICKQSDMIWIFGGDGTLLRVACYSLGKPIVGINFGRIGFLTEFSSEEFKEAIKDIVEGNYQVEERPVLEAKITSGETFKALNDIVVERGETAKMFFGELKINKMFVSSYKADGIIVSSPVGSTAYSLSSGGPIVEPNTGVVTITPISPHMLSMRTIVIKDESEVEIQTKTNCLLNCDGEVVKKLKNREKVTIKKATQTVKLIINKNRNYYEALREKLYWGKN